MMGREQRSQDIRTESDGMDEADELNREAAAG